MIIDLLYALIFEPQLASCVDITESKEVMQRTMISNMLHLEPDHDSAIERLLRYKVLSLGLNFNEICKWDGVCCENGSVIRILWKTSIKIEYLDADWLPNAVTELCLYRQRVKTLNTRLLPRDLRILEIIECGVRGEVDFKNLPERLQALNLSENNISGTLNLSYLPPNIRTMDVRWNEFVLVEVRNASLPVSLKWIKVRQTFMVKKDLVDGDKNMDKRVIIQKIT